MVSIEVSLNGKRLATAGVPGKGVVTAIVTCAQREGDTAGSARAPRKK